MSSVGSSGIRRRKQVHHLPKVHDGLSPAEEARALDQFRWSQYNHVTVTIGWSLLAMFSGGVALFVVLTLLPSTVGAP